MDIPIICYCAHNKCDASKIANRLLMKKQFVNVNHYSEVCKNIDKKINYNLIFSDGIYMTTYDIVIIGGGIAGIYTMYSLSIKFPQLKIILLETNKRFGGRVYTYNKHYNLQI